MYPQTTKTLIIHPGALGDVLLSLPAILRTKDLYKTDIHLCSQPQIAHLLKQLSIINDYSDINSAFWLSLYADNLSDAWIDFVSSFTQVYYYSSKPNLVNTSSLASICSGFKVISTIPSEAIHVASYRLRQIDPQMHKAQAQRLSVSDELLEHVKQLLRSKCHKKEQKIAVIHAGSGSQSKNIALPIFLNTAKYLIDTKGCFVVFLTGPAELSELINRIDDFCKKTQHACHLHCLPLIEVSAILAVSDLYIGNDSGISHLAGFFASKLIVLFCVTDPILWSPLSANITIIMQDYDTALRHQVISSFD